MSERGLRGLTALFIVLSIAVLVGWPLWVGRPPQKRSEARVYVRRGLVTVSALLVCVVGAGVSSVLLVRRAREEYRREALKNMQALVEGTRADHRSAQTEADEPNA